MRAYTCAACHKPGPTPGCPICEFYVAPPLEVIGYDGNAIRKGDRIELHPVTELWMQGARYGDVVDVREGLVWFTLDKTGDKLRSSLGRNIRLVP